MLINFCQCFNSDVDPDPNYVRPPWSGSRRYKVADLFIKSDNVKTIKQILFLQVNFVGNFYFNFQATFYPLDPGLHVDDRCGSRIRIRIDTLTLSRN